MTRTSPSRCRRGSPRAAPAAARPGCAGRAARRLDRAHRRRCSIALMSARAGSGHRSCTRAGARRRGSSGSRRQAAAHERPHRQRDDRVDDDAEHDLAQQLEADRRVDAEQELASASSPPAPDAERGGADEQRRERRLRVAQLAQAPGTSSRSAVKISERHAERLHAARDRRAGRRAKPVTAPSVEPHSRPTKATSSGERSDADAEHRHLGDDADLEEHDARSRAPRCARAARASAFPLITPPPVEASCSPRGAPCSGRAAGSRRARLRFAGSDAARRRSAPARRRGCADWRAGAR